MSTIDYKVILGIIQQLNSFADSAEATMNQTWSNFSAAQNQLAGKQTAAMQKLNSDHKASRNAADSKAMSALRDAESIRNEILKLDKTLTDADKYYVKTKKKKQQELASVQSQKHLDDTDYFDSLKSIREQFNVLTKKYSEHILPALFNSIHYIFSSQRKKEYEELIVLLNTVESLIAEIKKFIPEISRENLSNIDEQFVNRQRELEAKSEMEKAALSSQYESDIENLADLICQQLDAILPDDVLSQIAEITALYYDGLCKVNTNRNNSKDYFVLGFLDYPLGLYVQSPILVSLIQDKCTLILTENQTLRFPIICRKNQVMSWMIKNDGTNNEDILQLIQSIMLEFLSEVPITQLTYTIIDPESRGNSIAPFFDIRKKLPDLFDDKVFVSKDEIYEKLNEINEYIDQTLQNRVGSQFETIFDYEKETPDFSTPIQLLLIYDFPKGFDEQSLAALRNVLRNGYKCGIYVFIYQDTINGITGYNNIGDVLNLIDEMCTMVQQEGSDLFMSGLDISYPELPAKQELGKFFNKYLLIYEGIKNKGLAFPEIIKKLMDIADPIELDNHIKYITDMMRQHETSDIHVPSVDTAFPSTVMLGSVDYPMDIFTDSMGFESIQKTFGSKTNKNDDLGIAELPLTCDLSNMFNLLIDCPETSNKEVLNFTHHVLWSFLASLPIGKINLCIFDGELRGNSIILNSRKFTYRIADRFQNKPLPFIGFERDHFAVVVHFTFLST